MKYKIFSLLFAIMASVEMMTASNFKAKYGNLYYEIFTSDKTAMVTYDTGTSNNYNGLTEANIPSSIVVDTNGDGIKETYTVISIGAKAFFYASSLVSVTIPNTINSIGNEAFYNCAGLTSIAIPNSVTSIGNSTFSCCSNLSSIDLPNSITSIGNSTFNGCSNLTNIAIPNSITSIGNSIFSGCSNLTNIAIPNSITSIGDFAFFHCSSIKSIEIPNSVTSIGEGAFSGCSGLTSVTIPSGLTSIKKATFENCSNLTNVNAHNNVTNIGDKAFKSCTSLTYITIPNSVTNIGYQSFYNCSNLTDIVIPDNVTSLGKSAFQGCSALITATIGDNVSKINEYAFYSCSNLTSVSIGNSVTSIEQYAFQNCTNLVSVTMGSGVTTMGYKAFDNCRNLTAVYISDLASWCKIKSFSYGSNPLGYAHNLYLNGELLINLVIPNSVTEIGSFAFGGCTCIQDVTIHNDVKRIEEDAFADCGNLKAVYIYDLASWCAVDFQTISSHPLSSGSGNLFLNGELLTDVVLPDNIKSISNFTFYRCESIKSIKISQSVKSIGRGAFANCTKLTTVEIPNSVTSIGNSAFGGCSSLASIVIPNSITNIEEGVFRGCTNMTEISFSENISNIGENAFRECYSLTSVTIPNSVTYIGDFSFLQCWHLTNINIGNNVTYIGKAAFSQCSSLTEISIPSSVETFGYKSFSNCPKLESIYNYAKTPQIIQSSYESPDLGVDKSQCTLYVPEESIVLYRAADVWKDFTNILPLHGSSSITYYTVIFQNWDGTELKKVQVEEGTSAVAPEEPMRKGYTFIGWDVEFDNVTEDLIVTALFDKNLPEPEGQVTITINLNSATEMAYIGCMATPSVADGVLTVDYTTGVWQWAGIEFELDNFDEITNISFEYQGDGQNIVIYPYLRDSEGNRWRKDSYWLNLSNTSWLSETNYLPDAPLWDAPAYAYGEKPMVKLGFVANPGDVTTGLFKLRNIKVQGVKTIRMCSWSVESSDEAMGFVKTAYSEPAYDYGTIVEAEAIPVSGYKFVKWNDGNTINPYRVELLENTCLMALFVAEDVIPEETNVQPTETTATFTWPLISGAYVYTLTIYLDDDFKEPLCDIFFDKFGVFINRVFRVPSRHNMAKGEAFIYTITDLTPNTQYGYVMKVHDQNEKLLNTDIGFFTTKGTPTAVEEISGQQLDGSTQKILRNAHLYILRDGVIYNAQGARVE